VAASPPAPSLSRLFLSRARSKGNPVKKLILSLFALTLLAAGPAFADTYSGEITKIDRSSKSIEVRGGDPVRKKLFFLSRKGEVTRAGAPVEFRELKRGDRVEVAFQRKGSTHTATQIAVAGAPSDAIATRE
jgi:Cu/Ag efflux protein CusF